LFEEELKLSRRTFFVVIGAIVAALLAVAGIFGHGFYQQLVLGQPWGDRPMSDSHLVFLGLAIMGLVLMTDVPVVLLLINLRQRTRLTGTHLTVDAPLAGQKVAVRDIEHWEVRRARRRGVHYKFRRGWEINLAGGHCIHFITRQKKRFAIGTCRIEEFKAALEQACGLQEGMHRAAAFGSA
jgi:hypothetical protein